MSNFELKAFNGQELRLFRKLHALHQSDLSRILGLSQSAISLYEAGKQPIPMEVMEQLSLEFGSDSIGHIQGECPYSINFRLHRQDVVRYLQKSIAEIEHYTPDQLYDFEEQIRLLGDNSIGSFRGHPFFRDFPYFLTCEACQEHYGDCRAEKLGYNHCKTIWLDYAEEL